MNRTELVERIAASTDVPVPQVDEVLKALQQVVTTTVGEGQEKVQLPGFVTFERVDRSARSGRNPSTGEPMEIPASTGVKITAGRALKSAAAGR